MQRRDSTPISQAIEYARSVLTGKASARNYQTIAATVGLLLVIPFVTARSLRADDRQARQLVVEAQYLQASGDWKAATEKAVEAARLAPDSLVVQQRAAEVLYLSGYPEQSLEPFDRAIKLAPESAASNWQRGIALATCGKFADGAKQFETHHRVNPDDVENSAWYFLCVAKTEGIKAARKTVIPSRGDRREPMMSILKMLQEKAAPEDVLQAAIDNTREGDARTQAKFYADLYVGLYYDSLGDSKQAAKYLKRSLTYDYSGYMFDTARVYLAARIKEPEKDDVK